jgi:CBS domain containing-hemolysin-like protein
MSNELIIILCMVLTSAFFAGMEIAFLSANKLRIELESNQGYLSARVLSFFLKKPQRFITTSLVGNNVALVIYGIFSAELLEPHIEQLVHSPVAALTLNVFISTLLIVFTAEFLPKALFRASPNMILNLLAIPFFLFYLILYPAVYFTVGLAEFILKYVLRRPVQQDKVSFGRVDLDNYVSQFTSNQKAGEQYDHEIKIFKNALDFSEVKVRECMIPRTEIVSMGIQSSMQELRDKFIETHLSKILIFQDKPDNIVGYVHSSKMFLNPTVMRDILLPVSIVPESMAAKDALSLLRQQRKSLAVVVDEFGGTAGMLTIEDLMEEIFGEIEDEHDKEELVEKVIDENEFIFSGRIEIDYVNEVYKLHLPVGEDYETLAGLILSLHGSVPRKNEIIRYEHFEFLIQAVTSSRIELVKLTVGEQ